MPQQQIRCAGPRSQAFEYCRLDRPAVAAVGRVSEHKAGRTALAKVLHHRAVNFLLGSHGAAPQADIASPFALPAERVCWLMFLSDWSRGSRVWTGLGPGPITREF